ncbi:hypothetical protein GC175_26590 [bacterium]|nr:hypothetical protein [bacterium]
MLPNVMRKSLVVSLFTLMLLLSACSAGALDAPAREVEISDAAALTAQDNLFGIFATGEATLTEAELSSFLTRLLEANSGAGQPMESVVAWIEPSSLHLRATLKEDVLLPGQANTADLVGQLVLVDGQLQLELAQAAAAGLVFGDTALEAVANQINENLAALLPALPLTIAQETGLLSIALGGGDMPAAAADAETIAGIVVAATEAETPEFTTLLQAVEVAGFAQLLSGEGPYTVFAPTDAAFAALPPGMLDRLISSVISTQAVLQYHVLDGAYMAADVVALDGQAVPTLFGAPLSISVDGETVLINGTIQVVQTDIIASNGVIHVIDTVLVPER